MIRLLQFKNDLLASCLNLVLSSPSELTFVVDLRIPLQKALKLGLNHLSLATKALDTLEEIMKDNSPSDDKVALMESVLPYLNDYLTKQSHPSNEVWSEALSGRDTEAKMDSSRSISSIMKKKRTDLFEKAFSVQFCRVCVHVRLSDFE
jgi:hypothetical protein